MPVQKFNSLVIDQMANETEQLTNQDVIYLSGLIEASRKISSTVPNKIRKGKTDYFRDDSNCFICGTFLDSIDTSHGEDRLYLRRDMKLVEVSNYGTEESIMYEIDITDALKLYDVDKAAYKIKDLVTYKKKPRNRIMPDGSIEIELVGGAVHNISPKQIVRVAPLPGNQCSVVIDFAGSKKELVVNGSAERIEGLAEFEGFEPPPIAEAAS